MKILVVEDSPQVAETIMEQVMPESLAITMPRLLIARVAPHLRQVTIRT